MDDKLYANEMMDAINYPCPDPSQQVLVNWAARGMSGIRGIVEIIQTAMWVNSKLKTYQTLHNKLQVHMKYYICAHVVVWFFWEWSVIGHISIEKSMYWSSLRRTYGITSDVKPLTQVNEILVQIKAKPKLSWSMPHIYYIAIGNLVLWLILPI